MDEQVRQFQRAEDLARKRIKGYYYFGTEYIKHEEHVLEEAKFSQRMLLKYYYQYVDNGMIPVLKFPREYVDNEFWKLENSIKYGAESIKFMKDHMAEYNQKVSEEANRIYTMWMSKPFDIVKTESGKETVQLKAF